MNQSLASHVVSHFVYPHLDEYTEFKTVEQNISSVCTYCGHSFPKMIPLKEFNLDRYTNWDLHKEAASQYFCLPCAIILKQEDFRRKEVVATAGGIQFYSRKHKDDRHYIIQKLFYEPLEPPFILSIPEDFKKHIFLRSKVNYNHEEFYVQFGENGIIIQPEIHRPVFEAISTLRNNGAAPIQIERNIYSKKIYELNQFQELNEIIEPWRNTLEMNLFLLLSRPD